MKFTVNKNGQEVLGWAYCRNDSQATFIRLYAYGKKLDTLECYNTVGYNGGYGRNFAREEFFAKLERIYLHNSESSMGVDVILDDDVIRELNLMSPSECMAIHEYAIQPQE